MIFGLRIVIGLVVIILLVNVGVMTVARQRIERDEAFHLAFVSSRTGYADDKIYRMRVDGRFVQQLTFGEERHVTPDWSPDGNWISFTAIGGVIEIRQVPSTGGETEILVKSVEPNLSKSNPRWSPDGEWLAFVTRPELENSSEIYRLNLKTGGEPERLTDSNGGNWYPIWSADSQWIVFVSQRDGPPEVYRVNLQTKENERLTQTRGSNLYPSLSPDGKWVVYNSNREGDKMHIYRQHVETGEIQQLTHENNNLLPVWSPGGNWIVYVSENKQDGAEIYLMNPDGSGKKRLTNSLGVNVYPIWAPPQKVPPINPNLALFGAGGLGIVVLSFYRKFQRWSA